MKDNLGKIEVSHKNLKEGFANLKQVWSQLTVGYYY